MSKIISIKLTKFGPNSGPFDIYDQFGNVIAKGVTKKTLINGISYTVDDSVTLIELISIGECKLEKRKFIIVITQQEFFETKPKEIATGCTWRHLTNATIYNTFYGNIAPYIIEYPFAYTYQDEILQNVKDYTKVYKYFNHSEGVPSNYNKIEVNDAWFNKAILYNGQQCTGLLELVPKPLHNLSQYLSYPKYNVDSKTITYTKSDNFYQYNTFWSVLQNKTTPMFERSCDNLSIDKVLVQANMDYSTRSFKKEPLRAKELKVRHILDDRSDVNVVSQFIITPSQISYK